MAGETIELEYMLDPDHMAVEIANRWREWNTLRQKKIEEWKELRNYIYATDTRTTTNSMLPCQTLQQLQNSHRSWITYMLTTLHLCFHNRTG